MITDRQLLSSKAGNNKEKIDAEIMIPLANPKQIFSIFSFISLIRKTNKEPSTVAKKVIDVQIRTNIYTLIFHLLLIMYVLLKKMFHLAFFWYNKKEWMCKIWNL